MWCGYEGALNLTQAWVLVVTGDSWSRESCQSSGGYSGELIRSLSPSITMFRCRHHRHMPRHTADITQPHVHDVTFIATIIYSVNSKCYSKCLRRHHSLFFFAFMWRCNGGVAKPADWQLTDIPQATLDLREAARSKNTPAIVASGNVGDCHFKRRKLLQV